MKLATQLISYGADREFVMNTLECIKMEKQTEARANYKRRKANEKEDDVRLALSCYLSNPKVKFWHHSNIKSKRNKPCEVHGCPTISVRQVTVAYEAIVLERYMCLSHYKIAERVLTDLPEWS